MASEFIINNRNVSNLQSFTLSNSGPGDYYWRLSTKYEDMDRAVYTKIQKFRVTRKEPPKPPPALTWGNTLEKQFYLQKPTIALSWDALSRKEDIAKWKIEISNSEGKTILTRDLTDIKYSNDQMKSGVYKVTLEAFDKNDLSLTKTLPKSIEILEMPFPKAPVLSVQNLKRNPTTNKFYFENGVIDLEWNFQPDAKTYEIEIFSPALNKSEKMISNKNSIQYSGAANGLNPGAYQVKITPIDQYSRRGPASEQFDFDVPNFTTLSAPKLKNLNIKQSGQ